MITWIALAVAILAALVSVGSAVASARCARRARVAADRSAVAAARSAAAAARPALMNFGRAAGGPISGGRPHVLDPGEEVARYPTIGTEDL